LKGTKIAVIAASPKESPLKTFQGMNNAPNISGFKLVECLHMKFSKTEEADRLQIERKRLTKTQVH